MAYPTLRWYQTSPHLGGQPIAETSTTALHYVGQRIRARDYTYGDVEFIYLPGVASTVAGDVVVFDEKLGTTVRATRGMRGHVAVAMAALTAGLYGWYAVDGMVPVTAFGGAISSGAGYLTTTAGAIDSVEAEAEKVDGLSIRGQPSGGFVTCRLSAPSANGNDKGSREKRQA